MEVVVSTRNKNKFREISKILSDSKIKAVSLNEFPRLPKVKENGETFAENACKKALKIARITKRLTIADDSGLEVDMLHGAPGVYSARFSGVRATDQSNNKKLLKMLEGIPMQKRRAKFVCCVAIADANGLVDVLKGMCRGKIAKEQKGKNGFGYDSLFIAVKFKKTFAELSPKVKNKISHRAKAFSKAKKVILKYIKKSH